MMQLVGGGGDTASIPRGKARARAVISSLHDTCLLCIAWVSETKRSVYSLLLIQELVMRPQQRNILTKTTSRTFHPTLSFAASCELSIRGSLHHTLPGAFGAPLCPRASLSSILLTSVATPLINGSTVSRAVPARQCQLASVYDTNSGVDICLDRIKIGALLPLLRYRAGAHALSLMGA